MELAALLLFAGCAAASFFFAIAETSLFALGPWRLQQLSARHPERCAMAKQLLQQPSDLLAAIAFGNTFANAAMVAAAIWFAGDKGLLPVFALTAVFVTILFGCEVFPKALALRDAGSWAMRVTPTVRLLMRLARPFHRLAQTINQLLLKLAARRKIQPHTGLTDEEYKELVELAYQKGALAASEMEIILQIIALDRRTVQEVMRPRSQMACLSDDSTREEMLAAARRFKHLRIPIYDETPDTIVGILNAQELLLNPDADLSDVIEFPSFVPASMNLLKLFKSLQRQRRGMAIVLDEFGGTAGLVTIEDILTAVVGSIRAEGEPEGFVMEKLGDGRWRVNAAMRLDDFQREYPELGEVSEVETLGGLVTLLLGVVPAVGDEVVFRGLKFRVTAADERRARELIIERIPASRPKAPAS